MHDEHGREMHGSWGNMITAEEAFQRMGADVMRWQYCMQPPNQNLLFAFGPGQEIQRKLLTFWNGDSAALRSLWGSLVQALRVISPVLDLIHQVNTMRRDAGLDITDRIFLTLPGADSDLLEHQDWIAAETLARSITVGDTLSLIKAT